MCRNYNKTIRIHIKWNKYEMTRDLSYVATYFFSYQCECIALHYTALHRITLYCIAFLCSVTLKHNKMQLNEAEQHATLLNFQRNTKSITMHNIARHNIA